MEADVGSFLPAQQFNKRKRGQIRRGKKGKKQRAKKKQKLQQNGNLNQNNVNENQNNGKNQNQPQKGKKKRKREATQQANAGFSLANFYDTGASIELKLEQGGHIKAKVLLASPILSCIW